MVDEWRHVDKFERILHVPACYISRELATRMAERIRAIAEEQANVDYLDALRQMAPQLGLAPEDAVIQHGGNADLQRLLIVRRDRITFISPYGNVQYVGRDLAYEEIPVDPDQVIVIVLTSSGLKDPGASRAWLPPVPTAPADFDGVLAVLRDSYGLALE